MKKKKTYEAIGPWNGCIKETTVVRIANYNKHCAVANLQRANDLQATLHRSTQWDVYSNSNSSTVDE